MGKIRPTFPPLSVKKFTLFPCIFLVLDVLRQYVHDKPQKKPQKFPPFHSIDYIGFTLIEIVIGISIFTILGTFAIPNILTEMPKFRLNGAAQQILGDMMAARMKAVRYNRKVKIFFSSESQYKICDDLNNDGTVDDCEGDAKFINIHDNYKGVTIGSTNNNPIFHPRGNASNLASVEIKNSSGTKTITIAITGRIRIN